MGIAFFLFAISVGIAYGGIRALLYGLVVGGAFLGVMVWSVAYYVPKTVEVDDDSVTLIWSVRRTRTYELSDIEYLAIHPPDPPQWRKRYVMGGHAKISHGPLIAFSREIGNAVREAYFEKFGRYPPTESIKAQIFRLTSRR